MNQRRGMGGECSVCVHMCIAGTIINILEARCLTFVHGGLVVCPSVQPGTP